MTTTATNPPTQNSNTSAIKVTVTNGQPSSSPARPTVAAIPTSLSRPIGSQVVNNVPPPPALSTPIVFALNQPSSTAQLASALEQQHSREVRLIEEMNQREKIKETRLIEALNQQEKNSYNECVRWWSCFRIAELKVVLGKFRISQYGRKQNLVDRLKFFYLENPLQRAELKKRVKEAYDLMNQPRTYSMGFGNSMYTPQSSSTNAHTPVMNTGNQGQNVAQEIKIPDEPMWERVKVVQQTMFGSHTFGNKGAMFYFQVELSPDVTAKLGNSSDPHKLMLSCVRAGPVGAIAPLQYPRYCQVVCNGTFLKVFIID
jgi:hypothetical protein